ncbi:MAG: SEC-C domain-containing protein [Planctomycetes bacterium]|nr:SEC-C domain-containing protein [Planctomycetota bacterium]
MRVGGARLYIDDDGIFRNPISDFIGVPQGTTVHVAGKLTHSQGPGWSGIHIGHMQVGGEKLNPVPHESIEQVHQRLYSTAIPLPEGMVVGESVAGEVPKPRSRVGRNDLCPCGSGKKYKKCCASN